MDALFILMNAAIYTACVSTPGSWQLKCVFTHQPQHVWDVSNTQVTRFVELHAAPKQLMLLH